MIARPAFDFEPMNRPVVPRLYGRGSSQIRDESMLAGGGAFFVWTNHERNSFASDRKLATGLVICVGIPRLRIPGHRGAWDPQLLVGLPG